MKLNPPVVLLACLGALLSAACGSDEEVRAPYRSGLDDADARPVSSLDERDLQRLCSSFDAYVNVNLGYDAIAHVACLPQALLLGGSADGCRERMAACKADLPPPAMVSVRATDERVCVENLRQCDVNVSQLEGCVNVNLDWAFQLVESITCGDFGDSERRAMANTVSGCVNATPGCSRFAEVAEGPVLF